MARKVRVKDAAGMQRCRTPFSFQKPDGLLAWWATMTRGAKLGRLVLDLLGWRAGFVQVLCRTSFSWRCTEMEKRQHEGGDGGLAVV